MASESVSCFELIIQLPNIVIHGGNSLAELRIPQFTGGADPSPILCRQLFDKLANAISNGDASIPVNVDTDGQTIIEN